MNEIHVDMDCIRKVVVLANLDMVSFLGKLDHQLLIGITFAGTVLLYVSRLECDYWNIQ